MVQYDSEESSNGDLGSVDPEYLTFLGHVFLGGPGPLHVPQPFLGYGTPAIFLIP